MLRTSTSRDAGEFESRLVTKAKKLGEARAQSVRERTDQANRAWYNSWLLWPLLGGR